MLCGKELILATKPFAKEIRSKSWLYTITTLGLCILALSATVWAPWLGLRILSSIVSGLLLVRMFVIYHDHQHHTILHKSVLADMIMSVFGIYMLAPTSIWKRSHDHHHKHNSKLFSASIGSFPIATRQKYLTMGAGERVGYLAIRHPLTIGLGYFTMFLLGMCVSSFLSSPRKHFDALIALILHIGAAVCIFMFLGWEAWLLMFFVPFVIAFALGSYLFYAQHNFPGVTFCSNQDWAYDKAALESSSYMTMNPIMHWFTANIGYHHIHHLNAKIPFYRLPEVMKHFPELQAARTTSLHPRDIIACLKLKVWDQELGRMVSLKELAVNVKKAKLAAA
ncbi:fatty acid desaturase [Paraflavitalea sp. CAU 1676]|uniref:fatty acid desaturase family protein n=1 Tax=Paraflavitalea sp. CAU 1676 TaxID=3032598 RepID=UPI0023DCDC11|nr:fatty acid desaturase [Paraflavitalea sp. CAU 1676]MDF2193122.1 fatty acid desaturase [Paraflavitalea sp. CAU 1676]